MKTSWLNKNNNKNLIVFFAGWSFDENPFKFLDCGTFDVLFVYDYNDFSSLEISQNYEKKILITWSMGVFVAYQFKDMFKDFSYKIAVNGTVSPVDNEFGIPVRMFELTLKHAVSGLQGKFYQNVFATEKEYQMYTKTPVLRSIENRVSELENLYDKIKLANLKSEVFYDCAIVSDFDKIIPPKNQLNSHSQCNTKIITLPCGHFPFYGFNSWDEIIKLCK
jgi:biotin synthesis protein BioG